MKIKIGCIFIVVIGLLVGCQKDEFETPIDSELLVKATETNGNVQVFIETAKEYSCSNYQIVHVVKSLEPIIIIQFKHVQTSDFCLTSLGPAFTIIDLGTLDDRTHPIKFKLNGQIIMGRLSMNPVQIKLEEEYKGLKTKQ